MPPNEGLSIQEARDLITRRDESSIQQVVAAESSASLPSTAPRRAPPKCTNCGIQGHKRNRCPADVIN